MSEIINLSKTDIISALAYSGKDQQFIMERALNVKQNVYGNNIILRGVIEITNLCRVNCDYCPMRRENTKNNSIYLMNEEEILNGARLIKESGINIVFLQGGEIPQTTDLVLNVIPRIRELFNNDVEILLCLGNKSRDEYKAMKKAGADSYILKHETSDPDLHFKLRHEHFSERLECLIDLIDLGYKVGTGTIIGLPGQTIESIADDIILAKELKVHMASASPFLPATNTPLDSFEKGSVSLTLNTLAIMRLIEPRWLIPSVSALEKISVGGQSLGIHAGANVLTINYTPSVQKNKYLIYGTDRFIVEENYIKEVIIKENLQPIRSVYTGGRNFELISNF